MRPFRRSRSGSVACFCCDELCSRARSARACRHAQTTELTPAAHRRRRRHARRSIARRSVEPATRRHAVRPRRPPAHRRRTRRNSASRRHRARRRRVHRRRSACRRRSCASRRGPRPAHRSRARAIRRRPSAIRSTRRRRRAVTRWPWRIPRHRRFDAPARSQTELAVVARHRRRARQRQRHRRACAPASAASRREGQAPSRPQSFNSARVRCVLSTGSLSRAAIGPARVDLGAIPARRSAACTAAISIGNGNWDYESSRTATCGIRPWRRTGVRITTATGRRCRRTDGPGSASTSWAWPTHHYGRWGYASSRVVLDSRSALGAGVGVVGRARRICELVSARIRQPSGVRPLGRVSATSGRAGPSFPARASSRSCRAVGRGARSSRRSAVRSIGHATGARASDVARRAEGCRERIASGRGRPAVIV